MYSILHRTLARTNTHMVCNGDFFSYDDVERVRRGVLGEDGEEGGASGLCFMMARAALWNPSIFRDFKVCRYVSQSANSCL